MHEHPAIGLVIIAHLDHINVALEPEQPGRECERRTHWPAPVSVARRLVPATLLKYAWATEVLTL